ncbi:MAG TPA: hypothetical protein VGO93_16750 [Candidatus Xenobia bacterium]|jgi:hypothetical protein
MAQRKIPTPSPKGPQPSGPPSPELLDRWRFEGFPLTSKGRHYNLADLLGRWFEEARELTQCIAERVAMDAALDHGDEPPTPGSWQESTYADWRCLGILALAQLNELQYASKPLRQYLDAMRRTTPPWTPEDQAADDAIGREAEKTA